MLVDKGQTADWKLLSHDTLISMHEGEQTGSSVRGRLGVNVSRSSDAKQDGNCRPRRTHLPSLFNLNFVAELPLFLPHHRTYLDNTVSFWHYIFNCPRQLLIVVLAGQDESQVEKEESSQTEAQEKKDESQIVSLPLYMLPLRAIC